MAPSSLPSSRRTWPNQTWASLLAWESPSGRQRCERRSLWRGLVGRACAGCELYPVGFGMLSSRGWCSGNDERQQCDAEEYREFHWIVVFGLLTAIERFASDGERQRTAAGSEF